MVGENAQNGMSLPVFALTGKVAIVTGRAREISGACAITMAEELWPRTRVNARCPSMSDRDFHNTIAKDDVRTKVAASSPLKREGDPNEIRELVAFLATDGAGFVNGTCSM